MSEGFLGRWSRRKVDAREGSPPVPDAPVEAAPLATSPELPQAIGPASDQSTPVPQLAEPTDAAAAPEPPPPTLEDVALLTPSSDFSRFVARGVAPEVKNAAVKKLFADPQFNIMDGLDTYTGDYSQPDPMPESMLRQLASAQFLKLFDTKEEAPAVGTVTQPERVDGARDDANEVPAQSVAQSGEAPLPAVPEPTHDADPDLRLQQDDAAAGESPGHGDR